MNSPEPVARKDILVVDDTPANLHLLTQMLSERGFKVRAVISGARALAAVETVLPDLILLDIRMPEMNGYQVCRLLKENPRTRDVPIIFISALSEIQDKVKAFSVGGVDYITKPFQLEEVLARVETHLTLRDLQQQLERRNLRYQRELALARQVQSSFLPAQPPEARGWQFAVALRPAREMSGDFYDVIPLHNGRLGLLIADVVDKGVGAALFMVLSGTLIRTCAVDHMNQPEQVLEAANRRIMAYSTSEQFVTAFYGVLDPTTGRLAYASAGHDPPCLLKRNGAQSAQLLQRTGMPLGILEENTWQQQVVQLDPGDLLVLYTDGVTDAENAAGQLYGRQRLLEVLQGHRALPADAVRDAVLADLETFAGSVPQSDDIALVTVVRGPASNSSESRTA